MYFSATSALGGAVLLLLLRRLIVGRLVRSPVLSYARHPWLGTSCVCLFSGVCHAGCLARSKQDV